MIPPRFTIRQGEEHAYRSIIFVEFSKHLARSYEQTCVEKHISQRRENHIFPKLELGETAKPTRNQKNGEKWWNLKVVEGLRSGQSFESVVGACACVCSTGECPPLLGFGWDFLVNPSSSLPASPPSHPLPSELFAAELCAEVVGGREGNEEKERAVEVWKREWMTRRTREIDIRNPCAVGHRAPLATPRPMA